jgi:hypothetical protein
MTTFKWVGPETPESYKIERSICGFIMQFPNSISAGDEFRFTATSNEIQTIVLPSGNIDSVMAAINSAGKGLKATKNVAGTALYIRVTARQKARLNLLGSSAFLAHTLQPSRTIVPKAEWETLEADIEVTPDEGIFSYEDEDGDEADFYRVTLAAGGQPLAMSGPALSLTECMVHGALIGADGLPIFNALVTAESIAFGNVLVGLAKIETRTDVNGLFALRLLQDHQYLLQIGAVGYSEVINTNDKPVARLLDLISTKRSRFSPEGDPQ